MGNHPLAGQRRLRVTRPAFGVSGSVTEFVGSSFDRTEQENKRWPVESAAEARAWNDATLGAVYQLLRRPSDKAARVQVSLGLGQGASGIPWRKWDETSMRWVPVLDDSIWPVAQQAFDRHLDTIGETLRLLHICVAVSGRAAVLSYPVNHRGSPLPVSADASTARYKTIGLRVGSLRFKNGSWEAATEDGVWEPHPDSIIGYLVKDWAGGKDQAAGWVMAARQEIATLRAVGQAVIASIRSQVLAKMLVVPLEASPASSDDLSIGNNGPGLAGDRRDLVEPESWGDYAGGQIASMIDAAITAGHEGAAVQPTILEMDSEYVAGIAEFDLGRRVDPGVLAAWEQAVVMLAQVSDASTDAFRGAGQSTGFNRNIGDTTEEEEIGQAEESARWICDQLCRLIIWPYLRRVGGGKTFTEEEIRKVQLLIDGSTLWTQPRLEPDQVAELVNVGVLSAEGALQALRLPSSFGPIDSLSDESSFGDAEPGSGSAVVASVAAGTLADDLASIQQALIDEMTAASEMAWLQAGDRLGAILRSKEKDPGRKALLASIPNSGVAASLGAQRVQHLLGGIDNDTQAVQSQLWDKTLAGLRTVWNRIASKTFRKLRERIKREDVDDAIVASVLSDRQIDGYVATGGDVLVAAMTVAYTEQLLNPAITDESTAALSRVAKGEPVGSGMEQAVARAVAAAGGNPVDGSTSAPEVGNGILLGPNLAPVLPRPVGYKWNYGTAIRKTPAEWHVANSQLGVVQTPNMFDGWPNDHRGCLCGPIVPVFG